MISGRLSTRTPIGRRLSPRAPYQSATTTKTVRDKIRLRRVSRNQPVCGLSVLASAIAKGRASATTARHMTAKPDPSSPNRVTRGRLSCGCTITTASAATSATPRTALRGRRAIGRACSDMVRWRAKGQHHTDHR